MQERANEDTTRGSAESREAEIERQKALGILYMYLNCLVHSNNCFRRDSASVLVCMDEDCAKVRKTRRVPVWRGAPQS